MELIVAPQSYTSQRDDASILNNWFAASYSVGCNLSICDRTNSLANFHEDWAQYLTYSEFLWFSTDLSWWTTFWPNVTQLPTYSRDLQDKISKFHYKGVKNVAGRVFTRFSSNLARWLITKHTQPSFKPAPILSADDSIFRWWHSSRIFKMTCMVTLLVFEIQKKSLLTCSEIY